MSLNLTNIPKVPYLRNIVKKKKKKQINNDKEDKKKKPKVKEEEEFSEEEFSEEEEEFSEEEFSEEEFSEEEEEEEEFSEEEEEFSEEEFSEEEFSEEEFSEEEFSEEEEEFSEEEFSEEEEEFSEEEFSEEEFSEEEFSEEEEEEEEFSEEEEEEEEFSEEEEEEEEFSEEEEEEEEFSEEEEEQENPENPQNSKNSKKKKKKKKKKKNKVWVELFYRLFFGRYLFLGKALEKQPADQIMKSMIYLNQQNKIKDFLFYISCRGGGMLQGVAVFDVMEFVTGEVSTIGYGLNASMGAFLVHGGEFNKRALTENGRMMIHQPHMSPYDRRRHVEYGSDAKFMGLLRTYILETYIKRTRQDPFLIESLLERDIFLEPEEAKEVNLIDQIGIESMNFPILSFF